MRVNQKFGMVLIIVSVLSILLVIIISDNWANQYDLIQNLMSTLRIQFFAEGAARIEYITEGTTSDKIYPKIVQDYLIDIPTKYVVFVLICVAAYGLTTYLGITPVPRNKKAE